ncbi:MAG: hypothetical protein JW395_1945 [Nitrospira sp.]|nr:hypothetical protein [Nitrospira sp.]
MKRFYEFIQTFRALVFFWLLLIILGIYIGERRATEPLSDVLPSCRETEIAPVRDTDYRCESGFYLDGLRPMLPLLNLSLEMVSGICDDAITAARWLSEPWVYPHLGGCVWSDSGSAGVFREGWVREQHKFTYLPDEAYFNHLRGTRPGNSAMYRIQVRVERCIAIFELRDGSASFAPEAGSYVDVDKQNAVYKAADRVISKMRNPPCTR